MWLPVLGLPCPPRKVRICPFSTFGACVNWGAEAEGKPSQTQAQQWTSRPLGRFPEPLLLRPVTLAGSSTEWRSHDDQDWTVKAILISSGKTLQYVLLHFTICSVQGLRHSSLSHLCQ